MVISCVCHPCLWCWQNKSDVAQLRFGDIFGEPVWLILSDLLNTLNKDTKRNYPDKKNHVKHFKQ